MQCCAWCYERSAKFLTVVRLLLNEVLPNVASCRWLAELIVREYFSLPLCRSALCAREPFVPESAPSTCDNDDRHDQPVASER
jgi:hypothetical protein